MSDVSAVTLYQPPDDEPAKGVWQDIRDFFNPTPADPVKSRLERLDHISSRTWLPAPIRQEIGHCVSQGRTILSLRESAAENLAPWDVERAASVWQTEADGLIHRGRLISILSGFVEVALFTAVMVLVFHLAIVHVDNLPGGSSVSTAQKLETLIKSYLPDSWDQKTPPPTAKPEPTRAETFIATLKLATLAATATFAITTAILLFWSRGPRRWGMIFALTVCAPAIVVFATLSYTLAHQINQYYQAVLKRESAEVALVEAQRELLETRTQLAYETASAQSFSKDFKAFGIAYHTIDKGTSSAASQALIQLFTHFADPPAAPGTDTKTENESLSLAIASSLDRLEKLLKAEKQHPGTIETEGATVSEPPPKSETVTDRKNTIKNNKQQKIDQHKVAAEIDHLRRLQQMLENIKDVQLSRRIAHSVLTEAAISASVPEIKQALLDYLLDLMTESETASLNAQARAKVLKESLEKGITPGIATLKSTLEAASQAELREYSDVRNSLGDVSTLILGTSPLLKKKTDQSTNPDDKTTQNTLTAIDNTTQVVVAITMALLMFVCANEVIFVICVGVMVLLLPMLIHSLFSEGSRSWLTGTFGRILMLLGALWLLVTLGRVISTVLS